MTGFKSENRSQDSPVKVYTLVGYDSIHLDRTIHEKEILVHALRQEILDKQQQLAAVLTELEGFKGRIRYVASGNKKNGSR